MTEEVKEEVPGVPAPAGTEPTEPTTETPADTNNAPVKDTTAPTEPEPGVPSQPPHTEDLVIPGIEYDGAMVDINIPSDLANFAVENGVDIESVAKEVYSADGLSDETKQSLYDAFGKWQVDAYLDGIKAKDQLTMSEFKSTQEATAKAQEEAWNATMELMGGEDRWDDLNAYAEGALSEAEIADFNAVMKDGSLYMQKLAIADLWGKYESAGKPEAPVKLDLEGGDNAPASETGGAVTQAEYLEAFRNGEYRKDPDTWDKRRSAGISKGL
jgi:hypothetical protein